ncbi:hypothetical protein L2E82_29180 [Cichorium intybus]|uniref:Uncharacterized protein n=1 Tax=Cichorium intybus TaxID=13427 RepID=A0ACB9CXU7_CICIN|nr:hypothetical protein L2E82_29180 [Cichorium intybus]
MITRGRIFYKARNMGGPVVLQHGRLRNRVGKRPNLSLSLSINPSFSMIQTLEARIVVEFKENLFCYL